MAGLRALAFAATVAVSASAAAEPPDRGQSSALQSLSRFSGAPPMQIERRGFSFPVVDYADPSGQLQQRRGIIAGKTVAPNTVLGFGIFETAPKARGYVGDIPPSMAPPKRNRRAAVGLSMRF